MHFEERKALILYEDNHLLVVNKPNKVLSQKDKTQDDSIIELMKPYLREAYNKPGNIFLHPVHRIDRPASGALILAKTSKGLSRMSALMKDRMIKKQYMVLTYNRPKGRQGQLRGYLKKDTSRNVVKNYPTTGKDRKLALLDYEVLSDAPPYLLKVQLQTGRPHQIRVQLSSISCSILGDLKYGAPSALDDGIIALHSFYTEFVHPVKKILVQITAPVPDIDPWNKVSKKFFG